MNHSILQHRDADLGSSSSLIHNHSNNNNNNIIILIPYALICCSFVLKSTSMIPIHHGVRIRRNVVCLFLCYRSLSTTTISGLNIAVLSGSTRIEGPPNPINGPRVANFVIRSLRDRGNNVTYIDCKEYPLLEKPEFCYARSSVPTKLEQTHAILKDSDAYICITPEYNHAPSPGLVNVLNHFGSSIFSFKPSAIVSYSAGQWGGTRAAIGLRPILSELGCLPVSAMIHLPHVQDILNEDGVVMNDVEKWESYCSRTYSQLEWWAVASSNHKLISDPFAESTPFRSSPTERNAPTNNRNQN